MKCESIQTDLTALVFEELDTTRQDEIHLHLAECESCMEEYLDISDICISAIKRAVKLTSYTRKKKYKKQTNASSVAESTG